MRIIYKSEFTTLWSHWNFEEISIYWEILSSWNTRMKWVKVFQEWTKQLWKTAFKKSEVIWPT